MKTSLIRVAKECDIEEISKHLLAVGDLKADCFNCKEIGLNYLSVTSCPKCKTDFRYISSRRNDRCDIHRMTILCKKRPDLTYVEFSDIKRYTSVTKAKDIFL